MHCSEQLQGYPAVYQRDLVMHREGMIYELVIVHFELAMVIYIQHEKILV